MTKLNSKVSVEDMFEAMMKDMGLSMHGINEEVVTNMLDEVEVFASENGYRYDGDGEVYIPMFL